MLIEMKNRTSLTVEGIARDTGVPLGTAQKIFAGITKYPRPAAARALCNYLQDRIPDALPGNAEAGMVRDAGLVREAGMTYGSSNEKSRSRPYGFRGSPTAEGNPAERLRGPGEYTAEDYRNLPDDVRCELIDGYFYDMASPTAVHQRISMALAASLYNYIRENGGSCEVFTAPFDVQLDCDEKTMVQPDISVVCSPDRIREWGILGAPDLVMEILSPSTERKDRALKTMKYAAAGVREYWIVDPSSGSVIVHRFNPDVPAAFYSFEQEIPVGIYEGELTIRLGDRFREAK